MLHPFLLLRVLRSPTLGRPIMSDTVAEDGRSASDSNKLKSLITALKRMIGVRDIASMSLSLPAHILEPMPNLEYWNYQDRADMFVSIGTFDEPLDRMLAAVRYAFTKEHRFARGKVCKPYNSMVGEHFRCHWDVTAPGVNAEGQVIPTESLDALVPTPLPTHAGIGSYDGQHFRVAYLTEQVSQNPPVSYYYYTCPDAGLEMCGVDQISARFTGAAIRVESGPRNKGVFLTLGPQVKARSAVGEQYHFSHPCGAIHGLLRGSLSPAVTDVATVTCIPAPGSDAKPMRAVIEYKENGWLGKAEHAIEGCIYQYKPGTAAATCTQVRDVPPDSIMFTLSGTWRGLVTWQRRGETQRHPLINMAELNACERHVRPLEEQHPWESRRLWDKVTQALLRHEYSHASSEKHHIEHNHRNHLDERSKKGDPYVAGSLFPLLTAASLRAYLRLTISLGVRSSVPRAALRSPPSWARTRPLSELPWLNAWPIGPWRRSSFPVLLRRCQRTIVPLQRRCRLLRMQQLPRSMSGPTQGNRSLSPRPRPPSLLPAPRTLAHFRRSAVH